MDASSAGVRLDGWVTPRLETVLRRAAELSAQRGDNYLGVEHVVLAVLEEGGSVPMQAWRDALTAEQWRNKIIDVLPELPFAESSRLAPVMITPVAG